ncbi:ornithine decarboxylase antizyme 3 [Pelobates fuscus]|uniref:ornithine decarboxylase antizyme 3 n=1 Tax=Pelobates fuscus TaxID=191477 RepID=UPI002FE495EF
MTIQQLLINSPEKMLEHSQESLTAILEFAELKMNVNSVLVSVHKQQKDRGQFLRAFSYLGFVVVKPGKGCVLSCKNHIFMAYPIERTPSKVMF